MQGSVKRQVNVLNSQVEVLRTTPMMCGCETLDGLIDIKVTVIANEIVYVMYLVRNVPIL